MIIILETDLIKWGVERLFQIVTRTSFAVDMAGASPRASSVMARSTVEVKTPLTRTPAINLLLVDLSRLFIYTHITNTKTCQC